MQLSTGPPLLFAIGLRILLDSFNPDHIPATPDYLLVGIWQGVLLYHVLKHLSWLVYPVGIGITTKLLLDFMQTYNTSRCACTLLGVALGVLFTEILTQLFEYGRYDERVPSTPQSPTSYVPSRRLRLVSFDRSTIAGDRDRQHRRRTPSPTRARGHERRASAASPAPTALTSYTLDSLPSSIDPDNRMTPVEREVAVLRARASLADSERRRFKEERKWALSQGNRARASQLAWQVQRYTALMESFHREADAKVVDAAAAKTASATQAAAIHAQVPVTQAAATVLVHPQAGPSTTTQYYQPPQNAVAGPSRVTYTETQPQAGPSTVPLVSVTVGNTRSRKRSGGSGALKPAIYVHGRQYDA